MIMFKPTMLAIIAVLALQPQDSLANHITEQQAIAAFQALQAQVDAQQAQIDELFALIESFHPQPKTVFVTSASSNGDLATAGGGANGLDGADNLCQSAADSGIVPPGDYIAWLSTSLVDAKDRLPANSAGYVLPDGITVVATSKADLLDGALQNPILQDAHGMSVLARVWTATTEFGFLDTADGATDCEAWTSAGGGSAHVGFTDEIRAAWTSGAVNLCSVVLPIYCFER